MKKHSIKQVLLFLYLLLTFTIYSGCSSLNKNTEQALTIPKNLTQKEAILRSSIVEKPEYTLYLKLDAESDYFSGETTIHFQAKRTDEDLRIDFMDGTVLDLFVNEKKLPIQYNGVFINVPSSQLSLGNNTIRINYTHPYSTNGRGLHRFVDVEDQRVYLFSQFEPFDANRMFPCFDQPDLKATYTMSVEAPKLWTVISAEREQKTLKVNDSIRLWKFPKTDLFSTYIFSLHAGEYSVWESSYKSIPLRLFSRKSLAQYVKPKEWFVPTKIGLRFFPEYFGTPFPYKKYDQIIVPEASFGAMENVGAVTFNELFISRGDKTLEQIKNLDSVIYHEMAHMWFGNLVTMKWWNDLWLNESFATYMATVALAKATQHKNTAWLGFNGTKEWAYWEDRLVTTHPIVANVESTDAAFANFDGITYGKGAASLKQLVYYIGEEKFKRGLTHYFTKYSLQNTELKDFMGALSESSKLDLLNWQKLWLETSGVNTVSVEFECGSHQKLKTLTIKQTDKNEPPILRPHRVNMAFVNANSKKVTPNFFMDVNFKDTSNSISLKENMKCPNFIYPNYDDHAYLNIQLDPKSVKWLESNLSAISSDTTNTLMARMLWQDLWRMVRDGTYSVKAYAELSLRNIHSLQDPILLKSVLKIQEIYYYLPKKTQAEKDFFNDYAQRAEEQLWKILTSETNLQDLRKEAFYLLANSAESQQSLKLFANILNADKTDPAKTDPAKTDRAKTDPVKKFTFDQDMRWLMVKNLTRNGYESSLEILENEKSRDSSNKGLKEYYSAQASWPEWTAKELWIQEFKADKPKYSLDILRSVAQSIFPYNQAKYRAQYSKSFFMDLNKIIKSQDMSHASTFSALAPTFCENEDPDMITRYLDNKTTLAPTISKRLKITRQESERCRNIRQFARMKDI